MNLCIVSWNVQGKYSLAQLIDRMIENDWDMLIVLEPQKAVGSEPSHPNIRIDKVSVGDERIYVLCSDAISSCKLTDQDVMTGERRAALIEIVAARGASYRLLAAHAPYRKNDGTAAQYQRSALDWAQRNNIDLVIGDLNTYSSRVGSRSRSNFRSLSEGLATSSGGHPLDKALLRDGYYGLSMDVNANVIELEDIEVPERTYVSLGVRASPRSSVAQSSLGLSKTPDHLPLVVSLPAAPLLATKLQPTLAMNHSVEAEIVPKDGHQLYRCVAHMALGTQERYAEVRQQLADFVLANWQSVPYLQHLASLHQLNMYAAIVRNTAACGGEFELATLADLFNLRVTIVAPNGYAQAVYGHGSRACSIRDTGDQFEVS